MNYLLLFLGAYLIGSIPFGLLIGRLAGLGDIRASGSGNIGATNMLRTGGKKLAVLTLLLDAGKGAAAVFCAEFSQAMTYYHVGAEHFDAAHDTRSLLPLLAGLCAIIGHCFPIWLKFKGGKGVATTLGVYLPFVWPFLVLAATWLAVFAVTRISSLAAIVMVALMPVYAYFGHGLEQAAIAACMSAVVLCRHKDNIHRLLRGEEKRFNFGK